MNHLPGCSGDPLSCCIWPAVQLISIVVLEGRERNCFSLEGRHSRLAGIIIMNHNSFAITNGDRDLCVALKWITAVIHVCATMHWNPQIDFVSLLVTSNGFNSKEKRSFSDYC